MNTILVGDHEELSLILKVEHLTELGHRVVAAQDAGELEARLRGDPGRFDLVVTERFILNWTGGPHFCEFLTRLRPPPRLILTADFVPWVHFSGPSDVKALCDDYLIRPFSLCDLGASVERVLARGRREPGGLFGGAPRPPGGGPYFSRVLKSMAPK